MVRFAKIIVVALFAVLFSSGQSIAEKVVVVPLGRVPHSVDRITNEYYVSQNGNDTTGNGSHASPYKTLGAVMSSIGDAADTAEYEDFNKGTFLVHVGPGQYVENVTIPRRQVINIRLDGAAQIVGDIIFSADTILGASSHPPKLTISGATNRPGWNASVPVIGIIGDIYFGSDSLTNFVAILDLAQVYIQGDVICGFAGSGGNHLQLYTRDAPIEGGIYHTESNTQPVYLYLTSTDNRGPYHGVGSIGLVGRANAFRLRSLVDMYIAGDVHMENSISTGRLINVEFGGTIYQFGSGATLNMDAVSYESFAANLGDSLTVTINLLDKASAIANDSSVPGNTIKDALESLDVRLTTLEGI